MFSDRRVPWALGILGLCLYLYFWGLGEVPFFTKGEPREGVEVWEEVHNGSWVLPLRNGHELPSKPPLFHWVGGITALVTGEVDEFSIRFPSAFLATLSVLMLFAYAARRYDLPAGIYASLVLATNFEWLRSATHARVDMTLTACLTAVFVALNRGLAAEKPPVWTLVVLYLGCALAVLSKGPVGIVLPALAAGGYLLLRRELRRVWDFRPLLGALVAIGLPAIWYGLAIDAAGDAFIDKQIIKENFGRFLDADDYGAGHEHSVFYLIGGFFTGFAPWSFFVPPVVVGLWRRRRDLEREGLLFPLVWFVAILFFFSLSEGKRTVYLLPAYPAAAILVGVWWQRLVEQGREASPILVRTLQVSAVALTIFVVVVLGTAFAEGLGGHPLEWIRPLLHPSDQENLPVVERLVENQFSLIVLWGAALLPLLGLLLAAVTRRRWALCFAALVAFVASTASVVDGVFLPALAWKRTFKPFMEVVRGVVDETDRLAFYRTFDYGAIFYSRRHIELLGDEIPPPPANGKDRLYVLMARSVWDELPMEDRARLRFLHESKGTGPKGRDPLVLALRLNDDTPEEEEQPGRATSGSGGDRR